MPSPATKHDFLDLVRQAKVVDEGSLHAFLEENDDSLPDTPRKLADVLIREGILSNYQAVLLLKGKWEGFRIGPYRILERLGFGEMSNVYLCKHRASGARVAVKVLTAIQAKDPTALKRFYREARASASLDHPNIVRVRDIDWDDQRTNYMVMDFVDGSSIKDIVERFGPMDVSRAAHYVLQASLGLQHAHEHQLVHRDIKPGNLLVDRRGTVRILDMGLARLTEQDLEVLTRGEVLGAPEFLAPEQARDSHNVDIRADIYGLGATFYFMLTGAPPYSEERSPAQKILVKETRPPRPVRDQRPEVPKELAAVVEKMMAHNPKQRYQTPLEVEEALAPWTGTPIPPPPDQEMPQLSPAAQEGDATPARRGPAAAAPAKPEVLGLAQSIGIIALAGLAFFAVWFFFLKK